MNSVKTFHKGAFKLETGAPNWGASMQDIDGDVAIPFLTLGKNKQINRETDNSITAQAFKDTPRKVGEVAEESISMNARFSGLNPLFYWAFGFENEVTSVVCFKVSNSTQTPSAGAVYNDDDLNELTFYRREDNSESTLFVFKANSYASASTSIELSSGDGPTSIDATENSGIMYEHLYELDRNERHLADYRTNEQISGYLAGMKKNRRANIGNALGPTDIVFPQAMCKGFGFKSSSRGFSELSFSFLAHDQKKGSFGSSGWDYSQGVQDSDEAIVHHQLEVAMGLQSNSLVKLGVVDVDLSVDIPLQVKQDTLSGLYITEPMLEGKYDIKCSMTLSRYSSDLYQDYRDQWSSVVARVSAFNDYYRQDFFIQTAKISSAGPDDSEVTQEPITLEVGHSGANNWGDTIPDENLVQDSPLVLMVRDNVSVNSMIGS